MAVPHRYAKRWMAAFLAVALFCGGAVAVFPLPGQVPVLMYHFLGSDEEAQREKNFVTRESFSRQMMLLKFLRFRVISLDDYYKIKTGRQKPRGREIVITFDDGNYSFDTQAYPALEPYRFPVTLFVVSESVKRGLYGSMTVDTLKKLAATGWISIQSHSRTHPFLSKMTEPQIEDELAGSKKDLEEMFGTPVDYFAYPSGDFDERVIRLAEKAGYKLAFTTSHKKTRGVGEGPYSMTRIKVTRTSDNPVAFWFLASGLYSGIKGTRHRLKSVQTPAEK